MEYLSWSLVRNFSVKCFVEEVKERFTKIFKSIHFYIKIQMSLFFLLFFRLSKSIIKVFSFN